MIHHKLQNKLLLFFCLLLFLCGCAPQISPAQSKPTDASADKTRTVPKPSLCFSSKTDLSAGSTIFSFHDDSCNSLTRVQFLNVTDVTIQCSGTTIQLEAALRDEWITVEEIFCYARLDAKNGFCKETYESKNGLSHFTYQYPECNIRLIYDVYETPDKQQHLISDIAVYPHSMILGPYTDFLDEETSEYLDREDWGLTLESVNATPNSLTLQCTQNGGQQLGQLNIYQYLLSTDEANVVRTDGQHSVAFCDYAPKMGGNSELYIDWTENYGELPAGSYTITLFIRDVYEQASVHPLMRNFYDEQVYQIDFTIS